MVEFEATSALVERGDGVTESRVGTWARGSGGGSSREERVAAAQAHLEAAVVLLRDPETDARVAVLKAERPDRQDLPRRAAALARLEALTVVDGMCSARALAEWAELESLAHEAAAAEPAPRVAGSGASVERALRSAAAEAALLTRLSPRACAARLGDAAGFVGGLPLIHDALTKGRVTTAQSQVIRFAADELGEVPDAVRTEFQEEVLSLAAQPGHTRLRSRAARLAARLGERANPGREAQLQRSAREERGVWVSDRGHGMSTLSADVPTVLAAAIHDRLTQQAIAVHRGCVAAAPGAAGAAARADARTIGQVRADLLCELLLCAAPGQDGPHDLARAITAKVSIVVPALSLLGHDPEPALVNGRSPVGIDDAAWLAAGAPEWERILTDPVAGVVLAVGSREPTEKQRAFLQARDQCCRQPGCARSAHRCDLDHTIPVSVGGSTSLGNLAALCRTHHTIKHHGGWRLEQPAPGLLHWRSPTGLVYEEYPDPLTEPTTTADLDRLREHARERSGSWVHPEHEPGPDEPPPPF